MKAPFYRHAIFLALTTCFLPATHAQELHTEANRLTIGYNLELNRMLSTGINVGNGLAVAYTHNFKISSKHPLYIDFGPRLVYSRIGNISYTAPNDGYAVEATHYTNYYLKLPVSLSYRIPLGNISLIPYAGLQTGVLAHHEPNDHDGKIYFHLPVGGQIGLGAQFRKLYFEIEGSFTTISTLNTNIALSFGYVF